MNGWLALAGLAAAGAAGLSLPARPGMPVPSAPSAGSPVAEVGLLRRFAWPASILAGIGAAVFLGGVPGLVGGPVVAAVALTALRRAEDPMARRHREAAAAELPHLVLLLASALRGGAPPGVALGVACAALPGPAADRLDGVRARLALGLDPVEVWDVLAEDPVLAPLARTFARAARSGSRVADAVDRLSADLALTARSRREDRARSVGVRAALPLGLCLLPAFLLVGIVPLVAGLFTGLMQ